MVRDSDDNSTNDFFGGMALLLLFVLVWIVFAFFVHTFSVRQTIPEEIRLRDNITNKQIFNHLFDTWPDSYGDGFTKYQGIVANGIGVVVSGIVTAFVYKVGSELFKTSSKF